MNNELMNLENLNLELKNHELKALTIDIITASAAAVKAERTIVQAMYEVLQNDLWEEDFDSMTQYAEAIGYTKGYVSQVKRAGAFYAMLPDDDSLYSKVSTGTAYEYGAFKTFEDFLKFVDYCDSNKKPVLVGAKTAHELVVEYKKSLNDIISTAEEVTEDSTEDSTEEKPIIKITTHIAYKGKDYTIECDEDILEEFLKAYKVKVEKIKA